MIRRQRLFLALLAPLALAAFAAPAAAQSADIFKGFGKGSNAPIQVEADSLEVIDKGAQRVSTFRGNVTVKRGDTTIKAPQLTIYSPSGSAKPADGKPAAGGQAGSPAGDSFDRIEASGKVYINQGEQTATGDSAVFDNKAQTATITGNVVLTQGKNVLTGDRLVVDLVSGRARVEQAGGGGRIRGVFAPADAQKKAAP